MTAPNELHIVDTGDHSLQVTKKCGIPQAQVDAQILNVVKKFIEKHLNK